MKSFPLVLPVGLPSLRIWPGDKDRSSKDVDMYASTIDSSDVHGLGLVNNSEFRDEAGAAELRKGTRTDSSISS